MILKFFVCSLLEAISVALLSISWGLLHYLSGLPFFREKWKFIWQKAFSTYLHFLLYFLLWTHVHTLGFPTIAFPVTRLSRSPRKSQSVGYGYTFLLSLPLNKEKIGSVSESVLPLLSNYPDFLSHFYKVSIVNNWIKFVFLHLSFLDVTTKYLLWIVYVFQ